MDDKASAAKSTKNNDCYFYYYSSCSKGDACPFRHEPSALRNETVCIFWLQGNCNKANCIFRHMELTKQRDKIACWFETQPGGCKKPHCSFQHQNILDHPREEDIKKKPDLILPVKKEEGAKDDAEFSSFDECERQIMYHRNDGTSTPPTPVPYAIPRDPVIVPLQDGESDSESVSGSPYKRVNPELSAQLEWELRKLRQIQADEAHIIGYQFADDDDEEEEEQEVNEVSQEAYQEESLIQNEEELEEYVVEEIVEVEEEPDTAHHRLHPRVQNSQMRVQRNPYPDPVLNEYRRNIVNPHVRNDLKERRKVQISERFGGLASRALAETFGSSIQARRPTVKRLTNRDNLINISARFGAERLSPNSSNDRLSPSPKKKLSLLDRLGTRQSKEPISNPLNLPLDEETATLDRSIASRIMAIRNVHNDPKVDDPSKSKSAMKATVDKPQESPLDFNIKSLSSIRAEKMKKGTLQNRQHNTKASSIMSRLTMKNGTKVHPRMDHSIEVPEQKKDDAFKILSLSEIKAKHTTIRNDSNFRQRQRLPISFGREDNHSRPKSISNSIQTKERSKSHISFGMDSQNSNFVQKKKRSISPISSGMDKQNSNSVQKKKRSISPISFGSESKQKHVSKAHADGSQRKKVLSPVSFSEDDTNINQDPIIIGVPKRSMLSISVHCDKDNIPTGKPPKRIVSTIPMNETNGKVKVSSPKKLPTSSSASFIKENDKNIKSTTPKRSVSLITFNEESKDSKKVRPTSKEQENVQSSSYSGGSVRKGPILGGRKITINRSPAKNSVESERSVKITPAISRERENRLKNNSNADSNSLPPKTNQNNNRVPLITGSEKVKNEVCKKEVSNDITREISIDSKDKISSISLNRSDSFLDDEELLLLGGDTIDDEDDIDEAALLL